MARKGDACARCTGSVSWKAHRTETGSGLFAVRAATNPTAMDPAAQQSGVRVSPVEVRLGTGVGPSFVLRPQCPGVPPSILLPHRAFMLGGESGDS